MMTYSSARYLWFLQCQEAALACMHLPGVTSLLSSCTTQVGKVNTKWLVTDEMGIIM